MDNWQVALLMLAAVMVGVTVPMIVQYQSTLRSLNRLIRDNERDIRRTISDAAAVAANLNRLSSTLDASSDRVTALMDAVGDVTDGVKRLRGTLSTASMVGAAVAPAVGAAIRALQQRPDQIQQQQQHVPFEDEQDEEVEELLREESPFHSEIKPTNGHVRA